MALSPEKSADCVHASYRAFGLTIWSEFALSGLASGDGAQAPDLFIRLGSIPRNLGEPPAGLAITEAGPVLSIPGVARFLIQDGRRILVEPAPESSSRNIRLYLLGSALGAILHQRGLLPLHANAIEIGGRAMAFLGRSGAGKSTMAAWFNDRGYRILSDDVCVVTDLQTGEPQAQPGLTRLRLQEEALRHSGRDPADYDPSFDDLYKFDVPLERAGADGPAPLHAIYLIDRDQDGQSAITPLKGTDAIHALVANTYRGGYANLMGRTREHLEQCLHLVRSTPVFRVSRAWGFDAMNRQNGTLQAHFEALGSAD